MNKDTIAAIATSIVTVALVTTLVLPGRQTPQVISAGGGAFAGAIRAALGGK